MSIDAKRNGMPDPPLRAHPKNEGIPLASADGQARADGAGVRLKAGTDITNQIAWYDANDVLVGYISVNASNVLVISGVGGTTTGQTGIPFTFAQATFGGSVQFTQLGVTLANGANNNVNLGTAPYNNNLISGPTGAFNITGIAGGVDGAFMFLTNGTVQVMTLSNNNGGSSAGNKILTGTGADLVTNHAILVYDITNTVWRVY